MEFLPVFTNDRALPDDYAASYDIKKSTMMDAMYYFVANMVGADCWAITVNNELIFSAYNENNEPIVAAINKDLIRSKIIANPHSLFMRIYRREMNAIVTIYMNYMYSYILTYDHAHQTVTVTSKTN